MILVLGSEAPSCPHSSFRCCLGVGLFSPKIEFNEVKVKVAQSCPYLCESMDVEFSRSEYWNGYPFSSGSSRLRNGTGV